MQYVFSATRRLSVKTEFRCVIVIKQDEAEVLTDVVVESFYSGFWSWLKKTKHSKMSLWALEVLMSDDLLLLQRLTHTYQQVYGWLLQDTSSIEGKPNLAIHSS